MIENTRIMEKKENKEDLKNTTHNRHNGHNGQQAQDWQDQALDDDLGEHHVGTSYDTPLRKNAFEMDDETKIKEIAKHFKAIMEILGLDLKDDSLAGTPLRVAKMYVKEIFLGLNPLKKPDVRLFGNQYNYKEMLVEKDITFHSTCEHHFVPIHGKVHVAYMPGEKVVGLSKINRLVRYYAARPQVQERLTIQIAKELKKQLESDHVAVIIEADHMCVAARGIKDVTSSTVTAQYHGKFKKNKYRKELFRHIDQKLA